MSAMIWDETLSAFKEAETPRIYGGGAWSFSSGKVWNKTEQAWEDAWGLDPNWWLDWTSYESYGSGAPYQAGIFSIVVDYNTPKVTLNCRGASTNTSGYYRCEGTGVNLVDVTPYSTLKYTREIHRGSIPYGISEYGFYLKYNNNSSSLQLERLDTPDNGSATKTVDISSIVGKASLKLMFNDGSGGYFILKDVTLS